MALYVRRDQEESDLQNQITRNLRDKQKAQYERDHGPAEEADLAAGFKHGTKTTSPLTAVWIVILFVALGLAIWFIVISS